MNFVRATSPTVHPIKRSSYPLTRKLNAFAELSERDRRALETLHADNARLPRGTTFVEEGRRSDRIHVVMDGWAARYRILSNGKRQILNFAVPGDLVGVLLNVLSEAEHSVDTLTNVRIATFHAADLDALAREHPMAAKAIHWASVREWSMLCEHLVSVGRRCATARIAHLLLELQARLKLVGLASGSSYCLPITQDMLADSLGLTHVHVSRSLRKLSERGLIRYERHNIFILDNERLAEEGDFSDHYLDHHRLRMTAAA